VIVAMQHAARGESKIVPELTLPATSARRVTLVVTDLAVIEPTADGLLLRERAPGVTVEQILAATAAPLIVPPTVAEMDLAPVTPAVDPETVIIETADQGRRAVSVAGGS